MALAADEIVPPDDGMLELEAPMRPPALGLEPRAVRRRQLERSAIVDWRQAARLLAFAATLQLLRRLIGWIKPPGGAQFLRRSMVKGETQRLADDRYPG